MNNTVTGVPREMATWYAESRLILFNWVPMAEHRGVSWWIVQDDDPTDTISWIKLSSDEGVLKGGYFSANYVSNMLMDDLSWYFTRDECKMLEGKFAAVVVMLRG